MDEQNRKTTALHEAGHAVIGRALGFPKQFEDTPLPLPEPDDG